MHFHINFQGLSLLQMSEGNRQDWDEDQDTIQASELEILEVK